MEKIFFIIPFLVLYLDVKSLLVRINYQPFVEMVSGTDYIMSVLFFVFGAIALFVSLRKKQPGLMSVISIYYSSFGILYAVSIITTGDIYSLVLFIRIICTIAAILAGSYYIQKENSRLKK